VYFSDVFGVNSAAEAGLKTVSATIDDQRRSITTTILYISSSVGANLRVCPYELLSEPVITVIE